MSYFVRFILLVLSRCNEGSYVRFMEYESLSLSLHFPPITRIDVHYRIRICCEMISAISDGRVIDYFNARV